MTDIEIAELAGYYRGLAFAAAVRPSLSGLPTEQAIDYGAVAIRALRRKIIYEMEMTLAMLPAGSVMGPKLGPKP